MAAGGVPDIRVRLSAEGVQDVVNSFRTIAAEAQSNSKKAADSLGLLTKLNLGQWALQAAQYIKQFATESLDAQTQIALLMTKTGMTAPVLSVLSRSASLANGDLGDLEQGAKKLNTALDKLTFGDAATKNIFSRLGLSARDFIGLNADQKFLLTATALGKVADEGERSAIASALFGKSTGTLLVIADELGKKGFPALAAATRAAHQEFDAQTVKDAQAFTEALKGIWLSAEATAAKGVIPLWHALKDLHSESARAGASAVSEFESGVITTPTPAAPPAAASQPSGPTPEEKTAAQTAANFAKFRATELAETSKHAAALTKLRTDAAKQSADQVLAMRQSEVGREQVIDDAEYAQGLMSVDAYYQKRAARINAGLTAELQDLGAKRIAQVKDNAAELAAVDAQIAKEKALNGATADTRDLEAKRTETAIAGATKVAAIDAQIALQVANTEKERTANTAQRTEAERNLAKERLTLEQRIAEAQGNTYKAALTGIRLQADELAKALHTTIDDPRIQQFMALMTGQAKAANFAKQFDLSNQAFNLNTNALDLTQSGLQTKVDAGQMFPSQAQAAYSKAVQAQLPALQQQLDLLKQANQVELDAAQIAFTAAQATGADTTATREAAIAATEHAQALEQEQQKLTAMKTAADFGAQQMAFFKTSLESAMKQDIAGWLSEGIDKAEGFGDAMRSLALSLVQSMRNILAQIIANILVYKLLNALGVKTPDQGKSAQQLMLASVFMMIGGTIVKQGAEQLQQAAGELMAAAIMLMIANSMSGGMAEGGLVCGPGTSTSDSIPRRLSAGEYVVKASAVRKVGVHALTAINRGTPLATLVDGRVVPIPVRAAAAAAAPVDGMRAAAETALQSEFITRVIHRAAANFETYVTRRNELAVRHYERLTALSTRKTEHEQETRATLARLDVEIARMRTEHASERDISRVTQQRTTVEVELRRALVSIDERIHRTVIDAGHERRALEAGRVGSVQPGPAEPGAPVRLAVLTEITRLERERSAQRTREDVTRLDRERTTETTAEVARLDRERVEAHHSAARTTDTSRTSDREGTKDTDREHTAEHVTRVERSAHQTSEHTSDVARLEHESTTQQRDRTAAVARVDHERIAQTAERVILRDVARLERERIEHAAQPTIAAHAVTAPGTPAVFSMDADSRLTILTEMTRIELERAREAVSITQQASEHTVLRDEALAIAHERVSVLRQEHEHLRALRLTFKVVAQGAAALRQFAVIDGHSEGGFVTGPGTSTSDSILGRLSDGEFVVRSAAVREIGIDTLEAINRGARPALIDRMSAPRFADGGPVELTGRAGSGGQGGDVGLSAHLGLDAGLILEKIEAHPNFRRVVVRTLENNRKAANVALGRS